MVLNITVWSLLAHKSFRMYVIVMGGGNVPGNKGHMAPRMYVKKVIKESPELGIYRPYSSFC